MKYTCRYPKPDLHFIRANSYHRWLQLYGKPSFARAMAGKEKSRFNIETGLRLYKAGIVSTTLNSGTGSVLHPAGDPCRKP